MNQLTPDQVDSLSKLPALKGAPLSIFVALLIAQKPLMARQLETFTGYANQSLTRGLNKLADLQAVIDLGQRGWVLSPNWRQLPLPLIFPMTKANHENHDSPESYPHVNHENHDLGPLLVSSSTNKDLKDIDQNQLPLITDSNHENHDSPRSSESPVAEPENTALDESDPENTAVRDWLIRAGIAPGSPKMTLLLEKRIPLEAVKAHVLEHLAQVEEWEKSQAGRKPGTGLLIYHLEKDYPVPPMRCEECLHRLPCYCGIIQR